MSIHPRTFLGLATNLGVGTLAVFVAAMSNGCESAAAEPVAPAAASEAVLAEHGKAFDDGAARAEAKARWAALGFTTRMVSVNGVALHIAEGGRGNTVVLLHGYPQSGEAWRLVAPALARSHHVVVVDLRGMGLSEIAKGGYDLVNVAEDIHALVASIGVPTAQVVGHDWGAAVGAVYALRYRHEVTRLAFLESAVAGEGFETLWTFTTPNPAFTFIPFLLMGASDTNDDTTAALLRGRETVFLHHLWATFTGDRGAAPFSSWAPYISAMDRKGLASSSAAYYRSVYLSADEVHGLVQPKLSIPVIAMSGEKGIGVNEEALVRAFAENIVASAVLAGAGHFLPEERPTEVTAALQEFLR